MSSESAHKLEAAELQRFFTGATRAFGLHHPQLTPCGQPVAVSEAHALTELFEEPGLSQSQLAERLQLQKSTVSRLVGILVKRGWVERSEDQQDRRARRLQLTKTGATLADAIATARNAKFQRLLTAIPDDRRTDVLRALETLELAAQQAGR